MGFACLYHHRREIAYACISGCAERKRAQIFARSRVDSTIVERATQPVAGLTSFPLMMAERAGEARDVKAAKAVGSAVRTMGAAAAERGGPEGIRPRRGTSQVGFAVRTAWLVHTTAPTVYIYGDSWRLNHNVHQPGAFPGDPTHVGITQKRLCGPEIYRKGSARIDGRAEREGTQIFVRIYVDSTAIQSPSQAHAGLVKRGNVAQPGKDVVLTHGVDANSRKVRRPDCATVPHGGPLNWSARRTPR